MVGLTRWIRQIQSNDKGYGECLWSGTASIAGHSVERRLHDASAAGGGASSHAWARPGGLEDIVDRQRYRSRR